MTKKNQTPPEEVKDINQAEQADEEVIEQAAEPKESAQDKKKEKKKSKKSSKTYSQKDMDAVTEELLAAQKQRDEYLVMAQRKQAEFENFRKRSEMQILEANGNGARDTITAILPVIDNMQRALAQCEYVGDDDPLKKGIVMVFNQLDETLKGLGLEKIHAAGEQFDPNFHHAVMEGEATEAYPAGIVLEVLQDGYKVKDKIIRYAMVKVAR